MRPRRIHLRNIYNFDDLSLAFPKNNGIILVYGVKDGDIRNSMGIGKSSIFESMSWVLFGENAKGSSAGSVIKVGRKSCRAYLRIGRHKLVRRRGNYQYFTVGGKRYKYAYGKSYASKFMNLTFDIWHHVIEYSQLDMSRFILATKSEKKRFLSRLFMLDIFEDCCERAKTYRRKITRLFDKMNGKISAYTGIISDIRREIKKDRRLKKFDTTELKQNLKSYRSRRDKYRRICDSLEDKESRLSRKRFVLTAEIKKLERLLSESECPLCGADISEDRHSDFLSKKEGLVSRCLKMCVHINKVERKGHLIDKKMDLVAGKIDDISRDIDVTERVKKMSGGKERLSRTKKLVSKSKNKLGRLNSKRRLYDEVESIFHRDGFPHYYTSRIVELLNKHLENITTSYDLGLKPSLEPDDYSIVVEKDGKVRELKSFSGGEKRLVSIMLFMAFYKIYRFMNKDRETMDFVVLDEPLSQIDRKHIGKMLSYFKQFAEREKIAMFLITNDRYVVTKCKATPQMVLESSGDALSVLVKGM